MAGFVGMVIITTFVVCSIFVFHLVPLAIPTNHVIMFGTAHINGTLNASTLDNSCHSFYQPFHEL